MFRLAAMMYSIVGTTLAGSAMVAALVMGHDTLWPIMISVGLGALVAIPVSYLIAKKVMAA